MIVKTENIVIVTPTNIQWVQDADQLIVIDDG
jgi:hypothetical protein